MFQRQTVTAPGAGDTVDIPLSGYVLIVEEAPNLTASNVPLLFLDDQGGSGFPLYHRARVEMCGGRFNKISIRGQAASVGTLTLLVISEVNVKGFLPDA